MAACVCFQKIKSTIYSNGGSWQFYGRSDENGKYDHDDSDLDDDLSVCLFVKFYPLTLKTPKNVPAWGVSWPHDLAC